MKVYTIDKEFTIDYAHRLLLNYESKCSNIHGHTGKIKLSLAFDDITDKQNGVILDFNDLNEFIIQVKENLDHHIILNSKDELLDILPENLAISIITDRNPTCEVLSEIICKNFIVWMESKYSDYLNKFKCIFKVTFYETPTSSASTTIEYEKVKSNPVTSHELKSELKKDNINKKSKKTSQKININKNSKKTSQKTNSKKTNINDCDNCEYCLEDGSCFLEKFQVIKLY